MCDCEITEANLPKLLDQLPDAELILALQLLQIAKEYNCDLRGAVSAMKLRKNRNEQLGAYYQQHKVERNAYSAAYMREWRAKKATQKNQAKQCEQAEKNECLERGEEAKIKTTPITKRKQKTNSKLAAAVPAF